MRDDHGIEAKTVISFGRITILRMSGTFQAELQVLAQETEIIPQLMQCEPSLSHLQQSTKEDKSERERNEFHFWNRKIQGTSFWASNIQRTRCTNQILWLGPQRPSQIAAQILPGFYFILDFSTQVLICRYMCSLVSTVW